MISVTITTVTTLATTVVNMVEKYHTGKLDKLKAQHVADLETMDKVMASEKQQHQLAMEAAKDAREDTILKMQVALHSLEIQQKRIENEEIQATARAKERASQSRSNFDHVKQTCNSITEKFNTRLNNLEKAHRMNNDILETALELMSNEKKEAIADGMSVEKIDQLLLNIRNNRDATYDALSNLRADVNQTLRIALAEIDSIDIAPNDKQPTLSTPPSDRLQQRLSRVRRLK